MISILKSISLLLYAIVSYTGAGHYILKYDEYYNATDVTTQSASSYMDCSVACTKDSECRLFGYHQVTGTCELVHSRPLDNEASSGWTFGFKEVLINIFNLGFTWMSRGIEMDGSWCISILWQWQLTFADSRKLWATTRMIFQLRTPSALLTVTAAM